MVETVRILVVFTWLATVPFCSEANRALKRVDVGECRDKLPNCQSNLGLCTQAGELVFQHHYCKATCGNCGINKETIVPPCPAEYQQVSYFLRKLFTQRMVEFAWKFYEAIPLEVRVRRGANFVISPYVLASMLTVLYEGSTGESAKELKNSLLYAQMFNADVRHIYAKAANFFRRQMDQPLPKATELYSANLMYFNEDFKIRESFLKVATGCYDTAFIQRKDSENTAQGKEEINRAMQGMAYNLITDRIVDPTDREVPLNPETLTLVSAAYFKSDIDSSRIVRHKFYPPVNNEGVEVDMVYIEGHFKHHIDNDLSAEVLVIPLIHAEQTLYIILPFHRYGLSFVEKRLNWQKIHQVINRAQFDSWTPVLLPKIHAHTVIDAKKYMRNVGLSEVFENPNLNKIFLGHSQPRPISNLYHRTDFNMYEVDEIQIDDSKHMKEKLAKLPSNPDSFMAIHPFLFMVEDVRTGAILHFGRVLNPAVQ